MSEQEYMSQRERGGGGFKDNPLPARNHPLPQIFAPGVFFENKTYGDSTYYGTTTKITRLPR